MNTRFPARGHILHGLESGIIRMHRKSATILLITLLTGCGILDPEKCTLELGPVVVVEVVDSTSGSRITDNLSGTLTREGFSAVLSSNGNGDLQDLSGATPGLYQVTVSASGYRDWVDDQVELEAGKCRPRVTHLRARMQRA